MADLFYGAPGFMAGLIKALRTQVEERRQGTHPLEMNGLLSTATLGLRAPPPDGVRHEELVRLSDGGTMRLVWQRCGRQAIRSEQGVVIICPGLNNSSHWPAVQRWPEYAAAQTLGRGKAALEELLAKYHSACPAGESCSSTRGPISRRLGP